MELDEDERNVVIARKQQAHTIAKIATLNTALAKLTAESQRFTKAGFTIKDGDHGLSIRDGDVPVRNTSASSLKRSTSGAMLFAAVEAETEARTKIVEKKQDDDSDDEIGVDIDTIDSYEDFAHDATRRVG